MGRGLADDLSGPLLLLMGPKLYTGQLHPVVPISHLLHRFLLHQQPS